MSTAQRIIFRGIPVNTITGNTHTLTFHYDWSKAGIHAYDWLTSWAQAQAESTVIGGFAETLNSRCADLQTADAIQPRNAVYPGGSHATGEVPSRDPFSSSAGGSTQSRIDAYELAFGDRTIDLYGDAPISGVTMSLSHTVASNGDTGDSQVDVTLTWTSASTEMLIAFAGHLAVSGDGTGLSWGAGLGSANISGGPYHIGPSRPPRRRVARQPGQPDQGLEHPPSADGRHQHRARLEARLPGSSGTTR